MECVEYILDMYATKYICKYTLLDILIYYYVINLHR